VPIQMQRGRQPVPAPRRPAAFAGHLGASTCHHISAAGLGEWRAMNPMIHPRIHRIAGPCCMKGVPLAPLQCHLCLRLFVRLIFVVFIKLFMFNGICACCIKGVSGFGSPAMLSVSANIPSLDLFLCCLSSLV
jgi:hypothetical protein